MVVITYLYSMGADIKAWMGNYTTHETTNAIIPPYLNLS